MFRNPKQMGRWIVIAVAIGLFCFSEAQAKKPPKPGGGGAGRNGGGMIYFRYGGDTSQSLLYSMNDDGSGLGVVTGFPEGFLPYGEPSRQLHAGKRWFPVKKGPGGQEPFALSDAGDIVSLTIDPQIELLGNHWKDGRWSVGDDSLSWIGRRRDDHGAVVEGGLYTTQLVFDETGNVTGAGSTELLVSLPLVDVGSGALAPDIRSHDWAPDGTQFVYDTYDQEIVIADLPTGTFDEIVFEGSVWNPRWSPAGDKLMVGCRPRNRRKSVGVMNLDGSGLKLVEASGVVWTTDVGVWSPTGSHLVYYHFDHNEDDSYIARVTSAGAKKRRLTDASVGPGVFGPRPLGWRAVPTAALASVPEPSTLLLAALAAAGLIGHRWRRSVAR